MAEPLLVLEDVRAGYGEAVVLDGVSLHDAIEGGMLEPEAIVEIGIELLDALQPALASARQNLGLSLAVSGKPEEGVQMLGSAAQNGGTDRKARDNLAVALAMTGRTQEADKMLREEMSPDDASKVIASLRALRGSPPSPTPSE